MGFGGLSHGILESVLFLNLNPEAPKMHGQCSVASYSATVPALDCSSLAALGKKL